MTACSDSPELLIEAARQTLEGAKNVLVRDVGAAIVNAQWSFLRDRFDVNALVAHISETAHGAISLVSSIAGRR